MSTKPQQAQTAPEPEVDLDDIATGKVSIAYGIDGAASDAETKHRIAIMDRLRKAAIARTDETQWTFFGDKAYLNGSGAHAIAFFLGLSVSAPQFEHEDLGQDSEGADHVQVIATVTVSKDGKQITEFDDCTTFDDMLIARKREYEERGATQQQIQRIVVNQVAKKAAAGAAARAVQSWLGLRDLTKRRLAELGVKVENTTTVGMRKGVAGGGGGEAIELGAFLKLPEKSRGLVDCQVTKIDSRTLPNGTPFYKIGLAVGKVVSWGTIWKDHFDAAKGQWIRAELEQKMYRGKPDPKILKYEVIDTPASDAPEETEPQQTSETKEPTDDSVDKSPF